MQRNAHALMAVFAAVVAGLAGITAALGVFARGDGTFVTVTSVRGVTYEMATNGVYAYNSRQVVAEGVGWDVFTLVLAVPALLLLLPALARGSLRGRLLAVGLFGYLLYQYLEYSVTWAFGPLFPLFVVIYAASLAGIVLFSVSLVRDGVLDAMGEAFPRRSFAMLNVAMSALLTLMWIARIATGLSGDLVGASFYGETTMVVQALDLGLVVPTALFAAYLVLRRDRVGYVLGSVWVVTSVGMASAIIAMLLSAAVYSGELQPPPIVIFGAFAAGSAWVATQIYRGIGAGERQQSRTSARAVAGASAG